MTGRSDRIRPDGSRGLVDIGRLAELLNARIEDLIGVLGLAGLGRREGNEFVCLNPTRADRHLGSFRINLYGAKQGIWADFAVYGARGDALDLVAYISFGGDKAKAIPWAKQWLGIDQGSAALPAPQRRDQKVKVRPADPNPYKGIAQKIWLEANRIIRNTPVELYLRGRGIDCARLQRLPGALRYHPRLQNPENNVLYPGMVASVQDGEGHFIACHRTWLKEHADADGVIDRVTKAPLTDAKRSIGVYAGGLIPIWRGKSGLPIKQAPAGDQVAITEGIEDALTVALAAPELRVVCAISLANMANVPLPPSIEKVILIADNDEGAQAQDLLRRAIAAHRDKGRKVHIARAGGGCKDVNERLQKGA